MNEKLVLWECDVSDFKFLFRQSFLISLSFIFHFIPFHVFSLSLSHSFFSVFLFLTASHSMLSKKVEKKQIYLGAIICKAKGKRATHKRGNRKEREAIASTPIISYHAILSVSDMKFQKISLLYVISSLFLLFFHTLLLISFSFLYSNGMRKRGLMKIGSFSTLIILQSVIQLYLN